MASSSLVLSCTVSVSASEQQVLLPLDTVSSYYLKLCRMFEEFGIASAEEHRFMNNIALSGHVELSQDDYQNFQIHFGTIVARRLLKQHFKALGLCCDDGAYWSCVGVAAKILKCGADMRLVKTPPYVQLVGSPRWNPDFTQSDWHTIGFTGSVGDLQLIFTIGD